MVPFIITPKLQLECTTSTKAWNVRPLGECYNQVCVLGEGGGVMGKRGKCFTINVQTRYGI